MLQCPIFTFATLDMRALMINYLFSSMINLLITEIKLPFRDRRMLRNKLDFFVLNSCDLVLDKDPGTAAGTKKGILDKPKSKPEHESN